ncbi:hypothetical protein DLJ57_20650, partial [Micromonospora chalcea]
FLSPNGDAAERDADPAAGTAGLGSGLAADEPDLASAPTSGGLASASLETPVPAVAVEPIGPAAAVSSGLLRRVPQTDEDAPKDTPPSSAGID